MHNELEQRRVERLEMEEVLRHGEELLDQRLRSETWVCPLRTVCEILADHEVERIDLLKVDVEKSEAEVFAGIEERDWPKIRQAVVEVHDLGERLREMETLLRLQGFILTIEREALYRGSNRYNLYAVRHPPSRA